MPYGTVNADTLVTSTPQGVLGAGNASIMKNRLINGAMVIDQRNAGASSTSINTYTLDRFAYYAAQTGKLTWQQNAGSVPPVSFSNYLGFTSSSAYSVTSTDYFAIQQAIEGYNIADLGWGTANAKTVTLSFQVRSSLTGTFGGSIANGALNRCYPFSYTIASANTWTTISVTIAGDTTGTWLTTNGAGMYVVFGLGQGSTTSGTAGAWGSTYYSNATGATSVVGTSGATFYITGVQLEVGSSATGFEYVNYQTSLANCQRYFQRLGGGVAGVSLSATTFTGTVVFPVAMRTTPTASMSAPYRISDITTSAFTQSSSDVTVGVATADSGTFTFANFTGMTTGKFAVGANISSGFLQLSAEL